MNWLRQIFKRQLGADTSAVPPDRRDSSPSTAQASLSPEELAADLFAAADALSKQADAHMAAQKPAQALPAMDAAIASTKEGLGLRTDNPGREQRLSQLYGLQASIKVKLGDLDGASKSLLDSWVTCRALSDRFPADPELKAEVSIALQKIARVLMLQGRYADALKFIQDASSIMAAVSQAHPTETKYRQYFQAYTELLSECFIGMGKPEIAAQLTHRA
jgi:tetratricopeptide (TPR) repeat protein